MSHNRKRALVLNKTHYYNKWWLVSSRTLTKVEIIARRHSSLWITSIKPNWGDLKLCLFGLKTCINVWRAPTHMKLVWFVCEVENVPLLPPKIRFWQVLQGKKKKSCKSAAHKLILYLPGHFTDAIHANIDRKFLWGSLPPQLCAC